MDWLLPCCGPPERFWPNARRNWTGRCFRRCIALAIVIALSGLSHDVHAGSLGPLSTAQVLDPGSRMQQHDVGQASSAAAAAAAAATGPAHHGRSLKQLGYDPYGIGYYDPYQAGVTPGFVNVDLNRETGLHVDVGTVAVDVSADKNYYGLGVGNLVGVGAAKDRGWNLQLGGGNILDVSVTKDAGLGLWLLNGLANIQIGPDGRGWETGHIAAQNVPGQAATAAAAGAGGGGAAAAAAAGQPAQQVTSVVVDDPSASSSEAAAAAAAAPGDIHVASDAAAAAVAAEEPIITEEAISPELTAAAAAAAAAASAQPSQPSEVQSAMARSSAARRSKPRSYVEPRPATYVQPRPVVVATEGDDLWSGVPAQRSSAAAAVPYAAAPHAAVPAAALPVQSDSAAAAAAAAAAPRQACEGGVLVAVAGNRLKCKYRKGSRQAALQAGTQPVHSPQQ